MRPNVSFHNNSNSKNEIKIFLSLQEGRNYEDFVSIVDVPYAMIFIQRLSKLHEAAEKLKKTGYYKEYEQQFGLMDMLRVRETYYRRLKDG